MRHRALLALVVGLAVAASAVLPAAAAPAAATTSAPTDAPASATMDATNTAPMDTRNHATASNNTTDSPVTGLSMFTVSDRSPPPLKVGFSVVNDKEFAFAAYVDGEFVGGTEFMDLSAGSAVDGYEVPVEANVTGEHRVTVYAVRDSNGNGVADVADEPYTHNGTVVKTSGTVTFDASGGVTSLAFYTGYDEDPRPIRVGYTVEPNTTVAFALYADGELVGHTDYEHYDSRLHADGLEVPLERNLTGEVELTVVALQDANGNGEVDAGDEPHRQDGQRVASTLTFDFGGSGTTDGEQSTTPDDDPSTTPDGGTESTSTDESGGVPGFGALSAALGVLAAVALAGRRP
jgi:hypothetical protein